MSGSGRPIGSDREGAGSRQVVLAHGGGGALARALADRVFGGALGTTRQSVCNDAAVIEIGGSRLAVATASFVVDPLFFPGGDIGALCVNGTVNDLAMCGARPTYLCASLILEEGLELSALDRITASMRASSEAAGARFLPGDVKVVDRGKGDGVYVSVTGLGFVDGDSPLGPSEVAPGDAVLINGDIARHGLAVLASRVDLDYARTITSDCAPVVRSVLGLLEAGIEVHCLRALTRGGLAARLYEVARATGVRIRIHEADVPVRTEVREACDFLGLDPYHVSNEGRFVAFVAPGDAERALELLRAPDSDTGPARIGEVGAEADGLVVLVPPAGLPRVLEAPSGEQLPRGG